MISALLTGPRGITSPRSSMLPTVAAKNIAILWAPMLRCLVCAGRAHFLWQYVPDCVYYKLIHTYYNQCIVHTCKGSKEKEAVVRPENGVFRVDHRPRKLVGAFKIAIFLAATVQCKYCSFVKTLIPLRLLFDQKCDHVMSWIESVRNLLA